MNNTLKNSTLTRRTLESFCLALVLSIAGLGVAQESASELLYRAQEIAAQAQSSNVPANPGQPLWQEAIRLGEEALRLAPNNLEPRYFLADAYTTTGWHGPAWSMWLDFIQSGGQLDSRAQAQFARTGNNLAYGRYAAGDMQEALAFYSLVIQFAPTNTDALVWSGRIYLEADQPEGAIPFWRQVVALNPSDAGAAYFLRLAEAGQRFGLMAAESFYEGVSRYEAGDRAAAAAAFRAATEANPQYSEAWAWRGRVAFEGGNYVDAVNYYGSANRLEPGNQTFAYFLNEARRR